LLIAGRIVAAKGTTVAGLTVTIKDATSGAALGTAKVNARGGWGLAVKAPAAIPCLVSATVDSKTASHYVDRAPSCSRDDEDDDEREEHRSASSKTRGTVGKK
jgi:hypothetical protein